MKTSGFLSFSIENILKGSTNESVFEGEHLDKIPISLDIQDLGKTSSRPACTPSPIHSSSAESTGAEDSSDENSEPRRKKLRTTFCADQIQSLEDFFSTQQYLPAAQRKKMAAKLGLSDQQVKTWFQNRRMKEKRLQRESQHAMKYLAHEVSFLSPTPQIHNYRMSMRPYRTSDVIRSPTSLHHWQHVVRGKTSPDSTPLSPSHSLMLHPTTTYPLCINIPSPHAVSISPRNQTGLLACQTSTSGFQHAVSVPGIGLVSKAETSLHYRQQLCH